MINIYSIGEKVFVWNPIDVMSLREHRIVGSLTGIYPRKSFQVQTKWLPLQLMPEEACFLIEKGLAKLVSSPEKLTDPNIIEKYIQHRKQSCEEQVAIMKENRKNTILEKADEIYEGKKRKFMENKSKKSGKVAKSSSDELSVCKSNKTVESVEEEKKTESEILSEADVVELDKGSDIQNKDVIICDEVEQGEKDDQTKADETSAQNMADSTVSDSCEEITFENMEKEFPDKQTIIDEEIAKIKEVRKDLCMVQLFTECPWKDKLDDVEIRYPSTEMGKLRYAVFKDLWEKKYYITSGTKFGGDFLAYEGDPLKYHASFIVICVPQSAKLLAIDILTYGRLGHQVKKTVALASTDNSGKVEYISVGWANI